MRSAADRVQWIQPHGFIAPIDKIGEVETRLLEYFVAVAGELSVTEAAHRLYAAQSTVSAGLRSLETDLGVQLLHRTTQSVQLTAAGEELIPDAQRILDAVERLHTLARETAGGRRGRLTLGTFTGQDHVHDLPAALHDFRSAHPNIDLRLFASQRGSTGYAEDLIRGRLDVAFFALPPPPELDFVELVEVPYVALVSRSHPLATDATVSLARLASEPWIDSPAGYGNRVGLDHALARRRLRRQVIAEVTDVPAIPGYVATGMGVAVVPDIIDPIGCVKLVLTDPIAPWTVTLATRPNATDRPAVAALIDALCSHIREQHRARLQAHDAHGAA
jgi:DNA-binding transcriptional LysR family regulator